MSYLKKRIALFLCMVMAFTTVFCVIPQKEVQAATKVTLYWNFGDYSSKVKEAEIELGAKDLYLGDYVEAAGSIYYGCLSNNSGATYSSSNKNVIAIDKKGKITAKKTGTATITVKFKGTTGKCKLKVVKSLASAKKAFGEKYSNYEVAKKAAENFVAAYGNGITTKNRYNVLQAYKDYAKNWVSTVYADYSNTSKTSYYIVEPIFGRASAFAYMAYEYGRTRNPMGTIQSKQFKIKSIKGQGTKVTITLKSKVTEEQLVGIQYAGINTDEIVAKKTSTLNVPMHIAEKDWTNPTTVIATVKKGSNQITIKTKKLKKGKTYRIYGGAGGGWLGYGSKNPSTFKAK